MKNSYVFAYYVDGTKYDNIYFKAKNKSQAFNKALKFTQQVVNFEIYSTFNCREQYEQNKKNNFFLSETDYKMPKHIVCAFGDEKTLHTICRFFPNINEDYKDYVNEQCHYSINVTNYNKRNNEQVLLYVYDVMNDFTKEIHSWLEWDKTFF